MKQVMVDMTSRRRNEQATSVGVRCHADLRPWPKHSAWLRLAPSIDIMMQMHHDAAMRTTVDLPEDLHRIVTSLATHTRRSISATAVDLMRRGLAEPTSKGARDVRRHPVSGLPVVHLPRTITPEDVAALEDEA
jgi:hypothetical protein